MEPEAFLSSDSPWPGSASAVPATPIATGPVAANAAPKAALSPAQFDKWADNFLRINRNAPPAYRLELINWRHAYQLQQEAAEKQDGTTAEALRCAAERLARKAQSGFVGPPAAGPAPLSPNDPQVIRP